jgi:hypothetical protein
VEPFPGSGKNGNQLTFIKAQKLKYLTHMENLYSYIRARHGWSALKFKENCCLSLIGA